MTDSPVGSGLTPEGTEPPPPPDPDEGHSKPMFKRYNRAKGTLPAVFYLKFRSSSSSLLLTKTPVPNPTSILRSHAATMTTSPHHATMPLTRLPETNFHFLSHRPTQVSFAQDVNFDRRSKPRRIRCMTPSKRRAATSSQISFSFATQSLPLRQLQAAQSLQLRQLQDKESIRQRQFEEEQSIRQRQADEAQSIQFLQLQDALTTLKATQQLLESLCTTHFGTMPTATHLWPPTHAIPQTYMPAEPLSCFTAFNAAPTMATNPFDNTSKFTGHLSQTSEPSQKALPSPQSSLDLTFKSSHHTPNNSSTVVIAHPTSSLSKNMIPTSKLHHPADTSISPCPVGNASQISDIQSTHTKNPPPSVLNNPVYHPSTYNPTCPSKSLGHKIHSFSHPAPRSTLPLSLSTHTNSSTTGASNINSLPTDKPPSSNHTPPLKLDPPVSPRLPLTHYCPILATPTDVTAVLTTPFLPQTHRRLQTLHPISFSTPNPTLTLPIQAPTPPQSYSHQPSSTFLAFVQPFQALLSNLCSPLPSTSNITALPPIISTNLLLSQLNLFDSFPDHPG
jgi:hypothetical protein